jgi:hypothetical protein
LVEVLDISVERRVSAYIKVYTFLAIIANNVRNDQNETWLNSTLNFGRKLFAMNHS